MNCQIEYNEILLLVKAIVGEDGAEIMASYLDEYLFDLDARDFNLSTYLWNDALFNVKVFNDMDEAIKYVNEYLNGDLDDLTLVEVDGGVYLEYY